MAPSVYEARPDLGGSDDASGVATMQVPTCEGLGHVYVQRSHEWRCGIERVRVLDMPMCQDTMSLHA